MGAWIETFLSLLSEAHMEVAPYVGAWIETPCLVCPFSGHQSHPTWVRGLKQFAVEPLDVVIMSHPTWVRGLKQKPLRGY